MGALIFPRVQIRQQIIDIVQCLPGASMAMITLEEMIASGVKEVFFLGTAASVGGRLTFGSLHVNKKTVSVLNPFEEHETWSKIQQADLVDMESVYVKKLAKKRGIRLRIGLIVSDAIWKTRWEHPDHTSKEYQATIAESIKRVRERLDVL